MTLTTESALRKDQRTERATFQHRHFATIADILRRGFVKLPTSDAPFILEHVVPVWSAASICEAFADELAATNPKFNRARFMRACGLEE